MKTEELYTQLTSDGHLLKVVEGVDATIALDLASDLAEGIGQILERFYDAVNDGDSIYTSELKALSVMAGVSAALTLSVRRAEDKEKNNDK